MHTLQRKCSDDQEEEERQKKTTNYQNALRLQSSVEAWLLMLMMKLGMKFCCWYVSLFSSLFVCFLHCRCWRPNPRWEVHYHLRGSVSPVLQRHAGTRRSPAGRKSNCLKKKRLSIWVFWCPSFILPLTSLLKTFIRYLLRWLFHTFFLPAVSEQLFPLAPPSSVSPVSFSAHFTPAVAVSPLRQVPIPEGKNKTK